MASHRDVLDTLEETSRTFFIPISRLPSGLQEAVASAYLCMRAIDEIEDHPQLDTLSKVRHLRTISQIMQAQTSVATFALDDFSAAFRAQQSVLPEVTIRIGEWACHAPKSIAPRIWDATATMAARMADWVANGWKIQTEADLDRYTFGVAGAVGLLLCDLWAWFDGVQLDRTPAIQFGRGLQAVNMLRNRVEDLARGRDFFPAGWTQKQMQQYAHHNLTLADAYARTLPSGPFVYFIKIPLALAFATLNALAAGEAKLSRSAVLKLIQDIQYD
jgi:farnesyl-diphosphate farnesyltransferase